MKDTRDRSQYQKANKEAYRKRGRKWYKKNRTAILARQKAAYKANPKAARDKNLRVRHGVTLKQVNAMIAKQDGKCANPSCRVPFGTGMTKPCLDHSHTTKGVRGVLCNRCNLALGFCQDDAARIRGLADYLESYEVRPRTS